MKVRRSLAQMNEIPEEMEETLGALIYHWKKHRIFLRESPLIYLDKLIEAVANGEHPIGGETESMINAITPGILPGTISRLVRLKSDQMCAEMAGS